MKVKVATFFECTVRYERNVEDGSVKKVSEVYIVDALSFTETEKRITEEMLPYVQGDFDVMAIKRTQYGEYLNTDGDDERFYKAKVVFITIDEKTAKEKKSPCYYIVRAASIDEAHRKVDEALSNTAIDYEIASLDETKVLDVFLHDSNADVTD
jgi:hypothetical protein